MRNAYVHLWHLMGSIIMLLSLLAPIAAAGQSGVALVPGWNLVGNGIEAPITVATSFNDATKVTTIWKWVASGTTQGITYPAWAFYTPTQNDGGQSYAASKGYDFLTTINAGEGFWVNAKTAFTASLPSGTAVTAASFQTMTSGWNLIAIGESKTPSQFNALSSAATPLTTLWAWDAVQTNWYFYAPSLDNAGTLSSYIASKGYLDFGAKTLDPTTGFWVNKSATNTASYPAFVPPLPKIISYGVSAQVMQSPTIIPVFFPSSPNQADTVSYLQNLVSSSSWQVLSQYGVGPAVIGTPIYLSTDPSASITMSDIGNFVTNNDASWKTLTGSEIFVLYYPPSVNITDNSGAGYHSSTAQTIPIAYAVIPYQSLQIDAYLQYHEMAEAATDPFGNGYFYLDRDYTSTVATFRGTEIADICLYSDFFLSTSLGVMTRNIWSNSSVTAGAAPCAEPTSSLQMFGGVPILPALYHETYKAPNPAATNADGAVQIAPGTSITVQVKLFSYGPLPAPITLWAIQTNINAGETNVATFSFDKTTGFDGDTVNLTITAPQAPLSTTSTYITFCIASKVTDSSGTAHFGYPFPGMVIN